MRQAGIIAAAALYAFENHVDRLGEDHELAGYLASGLREAGYEAEEPETNLVLVAVDDPPEFLQALAREGVLATLANPATSASAHTSTCAAFWKPRMGYSRSSRLSFELRRRSRLSKGEHSRYESILLN